MDWHFKPFSKDLGRPSSNWTRPPLGHVIPLGWPRSVIRAQNFLSQKAFNVNINDPHFQYQPRVSQDACLVQMWWFLPKSAMSYHVDKLNFLEFWVKMAKMTLKVKVNDCHFQYQLRVSHDAFLVQIEWFHLKSVTSYWAEKLRFTDGRTDGQMQATTIPLQKSGAQQRHMTKK